MRAAAPPPAWRWRSGTTSKLTNEPGGGQMAIAGEVPAPDEAARGWWLFAVVGVLSVVAGAILVAEPSNSLATLSVVMGIFLLLDGIVELVGSFGHTIENRGLAAIAGILGIVIGIILIRHPTHAVTAIGLLIGIWLVAAGAVRLLRALTLGGRVLPRIMIALLEIAVGIAIVAN